MSEDQLLDGAGCDASGSGASPAPAEADAAAAPDGWTRATWLEVGAGVRSASLPGSSDVMVVCEAGRYSLDAVLQERTTPGWFVCGQVHLPNDEPASELEVVLHADQKPVEVGRTDPYGEFAFTAPPAQRVGVALRGSELALIELWRQA